MKKRRFYKIKKSSNIIVDNNCDIVEFQTKFNESQYIVTPLGNNPCWIIDKCNLKKIKIPQKGKYYLAHSKDKLSWTIYKVINHVEYVNGQLSVQVSFIDSNSNISLNARWEFNNTNKIKKAAKMQKCWLDVCMKHNAFIDMLFINSLVNL